MFGLFKKVTIEHPALGPLTKSGREWIGEISLIPGQPISLQIEGDKEGPHPAAVDTAIQLPAKLSELHPAIARALLEHLEPYQEALADPDSGYAEMLEEPNDAAKIAAIRSPEDAWSAAHITGVEIGIERAAVRLLITIRAIWDIEHTLGAFFDDWDFMELNGSI
jgi:hypothetical protein